MAGRYALGIDLGTTYSAAAIAEGGRVEAVTLGTAAAAIPSVVVLRADGEVLVGEAAERRAITEPTRTAREFKRRLGDPAPLVLGGTPYGVESLMAHLLRAIVQQVSSRQGGPPERIVVTHPANYGPYKKDLLNEMVRLADVGAVDFLTEPEAAAINYAEQDRLEPGEIVAVYDFGGGTFDAAVLRKTADGFELLGTPEGMERLGGIDFDQAIFAHVNESLGGLVQEVDVSDQTARAALARLRVDTRSAKEALSSDTDTAIPVYLPNVQSEVRLTREEFESMIRPRVKETVEALKRALRSASVTPEQVAKILLVGGSSRIPLVAELVRQETRRPVAVDADPKFAIALGAARHGAWLVSPAAGAPDAPVPPAAVPDEQTVAMAAAAPADPGAPPAAVPGAAAAAPRRSSRVGLVALVGALALLVIGGVAAFALMGGGPPGDGPPGDGPPGHGVGQVSPTPGDGVGQVSPTPLAPVVEDGPTPTPGDEARITTFAGSGLPGNSGDGGPARVAQLTRAEGLAVGPDGELYIVDQSNENIRVVRDGVIETFATDVHWPSGAAIDDQGNLYVADTANSRIVRFDPQGQMTIVAGRTGEKGPAGDGGPATQATLWDPHGVAVDSAGNVYIADTLNHRVRKVDTNGIITTVAGTGGEGFGGDGGPATQAMLKRPTDLAVDAEGNLYIADSRNGRIRLVDPSGTITTIAGNGEEWVMPVSGTPALQNSFYEVSRLAIDAAGNIYADPVRKLVRIDRQGMLHVISGLGTGTNRDDDDIPAAEAGLGSIYGIAVDSERGLVYLSLGNVVRVVSGVGGMR
jgi:actin-like ATPase involved in cell morphogenesis